MAGKRWAARLARWVGALLLVVVLGGLAWLAVAPPDLLRIGAGYTAKIVCSNLFIAGREPDAVFAQDVQAPGNPLLRLFTIDVDREAGVVQASFLGFAARNQAVHRPGFGCTTVASGDIAGFRALPVPPPAALPERDEGAPWPQGNAPVPDPSLAAVLADDNLTGPGMRGVVVVRDGRLVAERYAEGFSADMPMLGWSMTKTVTAALLGIALDRLGGTEKAALRPDWTDGRRDITLAQLMGMASGLRFQEDYGGVSDANRMLFLEPDMAGFAASLPLAVPPGTQFNYSSGTTLILARLLQNSFPSAAEGLDFPRRALFGPLGMRSAVFETDAANTFAGSFYLYATPRDWARFGQFLRQDGVWDDRPVLPPGFVAWMREPSPPSKGLYGRGQLWLATNESGLPPDTFWLRGHDGQFMAVVPSERLVVVRMGLTPRRENYSPDALVRALAGVER
ncbi:MAG: 6-aminohexanoate hydrolase [Mesorhizobium amorphae]|nr:MAG: 6-aminohexanoate hydrolase [Mesorhizobium amorphae]